MKMNRWIFLLVALAVTLFVLPASVQAQCNSGYSGGYNSGHNQGFRLGHVVQTFSYSYQPPVGFAVAPFQGYQNACPQPQTAPPPCPQPQTAPPPCPNAQALFQAPPPYAFGVFNAAPYSFGVGNYGGYAFGAGQHFNRRVQEVRFVERRPTLVERFIGRAPLRAAVVPIRVEAPRRGLIGRLLRNLFG
jgi:hypothetical protein